MLRVALWALCGMTVIPPRTQITGEAHTSDECDGCEYKAMEHHGGYCYMFREKPTETCMCGQYKK